MSLPQSHPNPGHAADCNFPHLPVGRAGPPPSAGGAGPSSSGPVWGSGNTLGSDTTPSTSIPDPSAPPPRNADDESDDEDGPDGELAVRHLTFWKDGFSIEDGELRRYDQPGNRELLEAINQGSVAINLSHS